VCGWQFGNWLTTESNADSFRNTASAVAGLHLKWQYDASTFIAPPLQDAAAG
jgi:hypothetical protein